MATPRANGQVERANCTIMAALMILAIDDTRWDEQVYAVQFAINNTVNKSTGKTRSQLLLGYAPRGGENTLLVDEVAQVSAVLENLLDERRKAAKKTKVAQSQQKRYYGTHRKQAHQYQLGDLVLIEKLEAPIASNRSRKLIVPYVGPMVVKAVLPNDHYMVADHEGRQRTKNVVTYQRTIAADRMRPWVPVGGVSDSKDDLEDEPPQDEV